MILSLDEENLLNKLFANRHGITQKGLRFLKIIKDSASRTPAHESIATVAPFRAWRGSPSIIARGPAEPTALSNKLGE